MGLITYKPTTPSYRKTVKIDKSSLFKGRPEKSLVEELQPNSGRNNTASNKLQNYKYLSIYSDTSYSIHSTLKSDMLMVSKKSSIFSNYIGNNI